MMSRNIYEQPADVDDEELEKELAEILKYYHPALVSEYRELERNRIIEMRQYTIDAKTTNGFEVGVYPSLETSATCLIHRFYCPPDTMVSDDAVANLTRLANETINFYNFHMGTNYTYVQVIKTMTSVAGGTWYYITFQASLPSRYCPCTFEAKLFESLPFPKSAIHFDFVRLKVEAGSPSSSGLPNLVRGWV